MLGGYHGSMHFIRFPTSEMPGFIELARSKNFPLLATTICATGGGAHKFSEEFEKVSSWWHCDCDYNGFVTALDKRVADVVQLCMLVKGFLFTLFSLPLLTIIFRENL